MSKLSGNDTELARQEAIRARCVHPTDTFIEFREDEIEQSLPECFEKQVAEYGDRIAVKDGSNELTYHELNKRANRIARAILEQHGESREPVGLLLQQGIPMISGVLGIFKSGKTYMPLASWYPRARNDSMLRDSQASLIVTDSINLPLAHELVQDTIQLVNINELGDGLSVRLAISASHGTTPLPQNGSSTVSPGLEYLFIYFLTTYHGFRPGYSCIWYRG